MARSIPRIPTFIYGTAWKEESSAELTKQAIRAGFDAIDTANQKKHYREDYVGQALAELKVEGLQRQSLFLQSKYTYVRGQDHRLPYNPEDSFAAQVRDSFQSSLRNLHTNYLDSYLLHGPYSHSGIHPADLEVWLTFEDLCRSGRARKIGVSNVSYEQLVELFESVEIKPMFVQNRCYAEQGWDRPVREFCRDYDIVYQGFSLLTANRQVLASNELATIAKKHGATPEQVIFKLAMQIGILPITGTTNFQHMQLDLQAQRFELSKSEVTLLERLAE